MAKHIIKPFKNPNIVSTTGSLPDNPSGLLAHPPKSRIVSNDPTASISGITGQDSFSERSPKASVKLTAPGEVS